jgi:hypothetical protein
MTNSFSLFSKSHTIKPVSILFFCLSNCRQFSTSIIRAKYFLLFFLIAFFGAPQMLHAQQEPSFIVAISHDTIGMEDVLSVSFIAENAAVENFNAPDLQGWNVLGGPNTSSEMQIINGKVSQRLTYTFFLKAPEEGLHIIGKATASINGNYHETEPKLVYVLPGKLHESETQAGFRQMPGFRLPEMRPPAPREPQRRRPLYRM